MSLYLSPTSRGGAPHTGPGAASRPMPAPGRAHSEAAPCRAVPGRAEAIPPDRPRSPQPRSDPVRSDPSRDGAGRGVRPAAGARPVAAAPLQGVQAAVVPAGGGVPAQLLQRHGEPRGSGEKGGQAEGLGQGLCGPSRGLGP